MNTSHTKEGTTENATNDLIPENKGPSLTPDSEEQNSVPFPSGPESSDAMLSDPIEEPDLEPTKMCPEEASRRI